MQGAATYVAQSTAAVGIFAGAQHGRGVRCCPWPDFVQPSPSGRGRLVPPESDVRSVKC